MLVGTNFEKARGFVRKNWKSKNFQPGSDPTQFDSSTDESDVAENEREEYQDEIGESPGMKSVKSFVRNKLSKYDDGDVYMVDTTIEIDNMSHMHSTDGQLAQLGAI